MTIFDVPNPCMSGYLMEIHHYLRYAVAFAVMWKYGSSIGVYLESIQEAMFL